MWDWRTLIAMAIFIAVVSLADSFTAGAAKLCKQSCGCSGVEYVSETECRCKE